MPEVLPYVSRVGAYISGRYYDNRGLLRKESTRWLDTSGNPGAGAAYAGWVDPDWTGANMDMDLASIHDYDAYGRATKIATRSKGNSGSDIWDTQYAYDGWKTTITDRNGNASTTNTLDARGNLAKVTQNDGATTTTTNYSYDLADRLDTVTHPDATTETSITYDLLGRKLSLDDPDMGTWVYTYDDNGNLKTQTDAESQVLTFSYHALNRPETKKNGSATLATWTYDTARVGFLDEAVAYQSRECVPDFDRR